MHLLKMAKLVTDYCETLKTPSIMELVEFRRALPSIVGSIDQLEATINALDNSYWPCVEPMITELFESQNVQWSAFFISIRDLWIHQAAEAGDGVLSSSLITCKEQLGSKWKETGVSNVIPNLYREGKSLDMDFGIFNAARVLTRFGQNLPTNVLLLDNCSRGTDTSNSRGVLRVDVSRLLRSSSETMEKALEIAKLMKEHSGSFSVDDLKLAFRDLDKILKESIADVTADKVFSSEEIENFFIKDKDLLPFARYLAFINAMSPDFSRLIFLVPPNGLSKSQPQKGEGGLSLPPVGGLIIAESGKLSTETIQGWLDIAASLPTVLWLWQIQSNLRSAKFLQEHELIQDAIRIATHEVNNTGSAAQQALDALIQKPKFKEALQDEQLRVDFLRLKALIVLIARPISRLAVSLPYTQKSVDFKDCICGITTTIVNAFPRKNWGLTLNGCDLNVKEMSWRNFPEWTNLRIDDVDQAAFEAVFTELLLNAQEHTLIKNPKINISLKVVEDSFILWVSNPCTAPRKNTRKEIDSLPKIGIDSIKIICQRQSWELVLPPKDLPLTADEQSYFYDVRLEVRSKPK